MGDKSKKRAARALQLIVSQPWAVTRDALETILSIVQRENLSPDAVAAELGRPLVNTHNVSVRNGVATIPIAGPLFRYANLFVEISGATSLETVAQDFTRAMDDPQVGAIVLAIDSPGGEVNGVSELAALIHAGRGRKPIVAHVSGFGASGAYWIAAAADEIATSDTGILGSIGVMMTTVEEDEEQEGYKVFDFVSSQSPNKNADPSTKEGKEQMQALVDQLAGVFVAAVAKYRGVGEATVLSDFGQGGVMVGRVAVNAGLADRVATYEAVHAVLAERLAGGKTRAPLRTTAAARPRQLANASALVTAALNTGVLSKSLGITLPTVASATSGRTDQPPARSGTKKEIAMKVKSKGRGPGRAQEEEEQEEDEKEPANARAEGEGAEEDEEEDEEEEGASAMSKVKAERDRARTIMALANEHGFAAKAEAWIDSGASVSAVRAEILAGYAGKAKPVTVPAAEGRPSVRGVRDREAEQPYGYLGEQLLDIVAAASGRGVSKRLQHIQAAVSGAGAGVGSDGGFLIQKDFTVDLMKDGVESGILASRCSETPISGTSDGLEVSYIDETSRATGSRWGGVQIYRAAEADTVTAKKPKIGKWELRLEDLMGLAYMTERLLQDAPAMGAVFQEAFRDEFGFVLDDEIYRANGVGRCLGILEAPCLVTVSKEAGQLADTIVAENVQKMWARVPLRSRLRGIWVYNIECEPQMQSMQVGTGTSNQLVYMPPGGLSQSPYGTIYGRPAIPIEQASALGDAGDISFLDLTQYKVITKGGIQADESIHVRFINNERTFRWVARVNGAPKLKSAITPYKGANPVGPFVTLGAR